MDDVILRYSLREVGGILSFKPHTYLVNRSRWLPAAALLIAAVIHYIGGYIAEDVQVVGYVVAIYLVLHGLYDIVIKANIRYTFNGSANAIFKDSLVHHHKKLMRLDEALIFVNEETGAWHYALGARKSHFVKNYIISEAFGSGSKSMRRQQQYEEHILEKIHTLIEIHRPVETPRK